MADPDRRRHEIEAQLAALNERVRRACAAVGRDSADITVVAVTKTFPASDIRLLADLGVREVGENRDQEAATKAAELADLDLHWHFVGQVQSRKARSVAAYADVVHSVDRARVVTALDRAAGDAGRTLRALVQVALQPTAEPDVARGAPGVASHAPRGGAEPTEVPALADAIAAAANLELGGVMAVAPLASDPAPAFARLAAIASELRRSHPLATDISAGMSGDLEAAIAAGATHLRVGSALLGRRSALG